MRGIQRAGRGTGARRLLSAVLVAIGGFTAFSVHAAPAQRIIVAPVADHANPGLVVDERALSMVATAHGVELTRLRTLATGAGLYRVDGPRLDAAALDALAAAAAAVPGIDYAEVDRLLKPMFVPNDTHYGVQWHYHEATGGLNLEPAWDVTDGSGAVVAVLDTGYRPHVDLAANIVGGYDMISDSFVGNDGNGRDSDAQDPGDWTNAGECGGGQPTQNQNSSWHGTHVPASSPRSPTTAAASPAWPTAPRWCRCGCSASAAATPPTSPTASSGLPADRSAACRPMPTRPTC